MIGVVHGSLPVYKDSEWPDTFIGYASRNMDMSVNLSGDIDIFLKDKNERLAKKYTQDLRIIVQRRNKNNGESWKQRYLIKGSHSTTNKSELVKSYKESKKISYAAAVTGDVKYEVKIELSRDGVSLKGKFTSEPEDLDIYEYRLLAVSDVSSETWYLFRDAKEKDYKSAFRSDWLVFYTAEKRPQKEKYKVIDELKLNKMREKGISSIELKVGRFQRNNVIWQANPGGVLEFKERNALAARYGFRVMHVLQSSIDAEPSAGVSLIVK